jgi:hypothetical protein
MTEPGGGVQCALHEQAIREIKDSMTRIEVNHGAVLSEIRVQTTATNGRLRSLERWKIGIAAGLAGLLAGTIGNGEVLRKVVQIIGAGG